MSIIRTTALALGLAVGYLIPRAPAQTVPPKVPFSASYVAPGNGDWELETANSCASEGALKATTLEGVVLKEGALAFAGGASPSVTRAAFLGEHRGPISLTLTTTGCPVPANFTYWESRTPLEPPIEPPVESSRIPRSEAYLLSMRHRPISTHVASKSGFAGTHAAIASVAAEETGTAAGPSVAGFSLSGNEFPSTRGVIFVPAPIEGQTTVYLLPGTTTGTTGRVRAELSRANPALSTPVEHIVEKEFVSGTIALPLTTQFSQNALANAALGFVTPVTAVGASSPTFSAIEVTRHADGNITAADNLHVELASRVWYVPHVFVPVAGWSAPILLENLVKEVSTAEFYAFSKDGERLAQLDAAGKQVHVKRTLAARQKALYKPEELFAGVANLDKIAYVLVSSNARVPLESVDGNVPGVPLDGRVRVRQIISDGVHRAELPAINSLSLGQELVAVGVHYEPGKRSTATVLLSPGTKPLRVEATAKGAASKAALASAVITIPPGGKYVAADLKAHFPAAADSTLTLVNSVHYKALDIADGRIVSSPLDWYTVGGPSPLDGRFAGMTLTTHQDKGGMAIATLMTNKDPLRVLSEDSNYRPQELATRATVYDPQARFTTTIISNQPGTFTLAGRHVPSSSYQLVNTTLNETGRMVHVDGLTDRGIHPNTFINVSDTGTVYNALTACWFKDAAGTEHKWDFKEPMVIYAAKSHVLELTPELKAMILGKKEEWATYLSMDRDIQRQTFKLSKEQWIGILEMGLDGRLENDEFERVIISNDALTPLISFPVVGKNAAVFINYENTPFGRTIMKEYGRLMNVDQ